MSNLYDEALKLNGTRKAAEHKRLGERVRALRAEGLTYGTIAQRLGISDTKAKVLEGARPWRASRETA